VKPADIHGQICEVYGENAMSDGMGKKWVKRSTKVVIMCMTSRGAAGCFHRLPRSSRRGYRNWCLVMTNALIMVETM
jgi:hypothetical protein